VQVTVELKTLDDLDLLLDLDPIALRNYAWATTQELSRLAAEQAGHLCSQCGQRTPVCATCGDSITYIPKAGFGREGSWEHLAPPKRSTPGHVAAPKIFVTPAVTT
jgi:hypothetical protein